MSEDTGAITVCMECAVQAVLKGEDMAEGSRFWETPQEHMLRLHPTPVPEAQRARDLQEIADRLNKDDLSTHSAMKTDRSAYLRSKSMMKAILGLLNPTDEPQT